MRWAVAGLLHLLLISSAFAAVSGRVESIGFGSYIRPDCWTPLLVRIQSDDDTARTYALQVVQLDLDGDEVVYTRPVTVNPGQQTAWTYFKPRPSNEGLPSAGLANANDLARVLRVYLATEDGGKRLAQIDVGKTLPQALESGVWESITVGQRTIRSGQKLVVVVGDSPNFREYSASTIQVEGATETVLPVVLTVPRLPDNVIGYDAVDAVIWTTADSARLDAQQLRALRQYVRGGGKLACSASGEVGVLARFDEMLPVVTGPSDEWSPPSLAVTTFAKILLDERPVRDGRGNTIDPFAGITLPLRIGRGVPKPDAIVAAWEGDGTNNDDGRRPLIVRRLFGLGSVSWTAVNVADASLTRVTVGWPRFWNEVFGWRQELSMVAQMQPGERTTAYKNFGGGGVRDLGYTYFEKLDLTSKTAALVSIVFVVFIGYWIIAGPVTYVVLAARKQTHLSWFVYGAVALLAVVLTLGIIRLMLGGSAEARHVSLVRVWCGPGDEPARVWTRVGVYLPQDRSDTPVALGRTSPQQRASLTPLVIDPRIADRKPNTRDSRYEVPIEGEDAEGPVELRVPFRSTLKKLQADWTGPAPARISGSPALLATGASPITGSLSNDTGALLNDVLIVFRAPQDDGETIDWVIYQKLWPAGKILNLETIWNSTKPEFYTPSNGQLLLDLNRDGNRGRWADAAKWLTNDLRNGALNQPRKFDDSESYRRSFPIASLFDAMPAIKNLPDSTDRVDLLRSGVRQWDVSHALGGGAMVVLATSSASPLPIPFTVDGATPAGTGQTLWQFIVPVDQSAFAKQPTTTPTTQPE